MMYWTGAKSAENIGLLKKMTKGSWRGPAAESAIILWNKVSASTSQKCMEHFKLTLEVCMTYIFTKHLNIAKGTTDLRVECPCFDKKYWKLNENI